MPLAAIIIADTATSAGEPLALIPYGDATIIEYQIEQLIAAGVRDVEVVLGCDADRIVPIVSRDNVEPVINARWQTSRASALRAGASAVPRGTDAAMIIEIDRPRDAAVLRALLDAHDAHPDAVVVPTFEGTRGTPVIVDEAMLGELRNVRDGASLDRLLARRDDVVEVPFETGSVLGRLDSGRSVSRSSHAPPGEAMG